MLSGWPSSSVPSATISSSVRRASPPRTKLRASAKPPTIAAADEPRPRPCGMALSWRSAKPLGFPPICSKPSIIALITRLFLSFFTSSWPSPVISISNSASSKICAAYISRKSRARPKQSNPGPRFALVAGTLILAKVALKVGRAITQFPFHEQQLWHRLE